MNLTSSLCCLRKHDGGGGVRQLMKVAPGALAQFKCYTGTKDQSHPCFFFVFFPKLLFLFTSCGAEYSQDVYLAGNLDSSH